MKKGVLGATIVGLITYAGKMTLFELIDFGLMFLDSSSEELFLVIFRAICCVTPFGVLAIYALAGYALRIIAPIPHKSFVWGILLGLLTVIFPFNPFADISYLLSLLPVLLIHMVIGFALAYFFGMRWIEPDGHYLYIASWIDEHGETVDVLWHPKTGELIRESNGNREAIGAAGTEEDAAKLFTALKQRFSGDQHNKDL